ncbi:hypothetical protein J0H58_16705 [bacterium]|nr:hypothetical protein [bacterium]
MADNTDMTEKNFIILAFAFLASVLLLAAIEHGSSVKLRGWGAAFELEARRDH